MRGSVFALVPLMLAPNVVRAQTADTVSQTKAIRVTRDCGGRVSRAGSAQAECPWERGSLIGADAAGLTWQPGGSPATRLTPWSEIRNVEVSHGTHGHPATGAAVGAVVGAIPGALSGMAYARTCDCSHPNYAGGAIIGALIFAAPGALAGAIVGQLVRTERWEALPAGRLRVSVLPAARGLTIGFTAPF